MFTKAFPNLPLYLPKTGIAAATWELIANGPSHLMGNR